MSESDNSIELERLRQENQALKVLLNQSFRRIIEEESIGKVFHDFNNILSSSMGYSSLALEKAKGTGDEKLCRYLDNIEKAGVRARDLVRERLITRQELRNGQVVPWQELVEIFKPSEIIAEGESSDVYMNPRQLAYAISLVAQYYDQLQNGAANVLEEPSCSECGTELRGRQLQVRCNGNKHANSSDSPNYEADIELSSAMFAGAGGHLCESLVQDGQFVVYLRAVAPEVNG